jgi:hypothetical protein
MTHQKLRVELRFAPCFITHDGLAPIPRPRQNRENNPMQSKGDGSQHVRDRCNAAHDEQTTGDRR